MIFQYIGSIILFLGLLQFVLGLNVGDFHVAKLHLTLVLTGAILILVGIFSKKKKQS